MGKSRDKNKWGYMWEVKFYSICIGDSVSSVNFGLLGIGLISVFYIYWLNISILYKYV